MSPPGLMATTSERRSSQAVTRDSLIRETHALLSDCGIERSPSWVSTLAEALPLDRLPATRGRAPTRRHRLMNQLSPQSLTAPKNGPRPGRLLSDGQAARRSRRQRERDARAAARRRRRQAFHTSVRDHHEAQNLLGVARVYFDGAGSPAMQANVREFVHRQAELFSKREREPFTTSLKRVEGLLLSLLTASSGRAR